MIYKNGLKEYSLIMLIFGGCMGLMYGILYFSLVLGLTVGIVAGLLFAGIMLVVSKLLERKFDKMRVEIAKNRRIICDGAATIKGNGGWMFLTEKGLEFYPHKVNVSHEQMIIELDFIRSVKTYKNNIVVDTNESGNEVKILVSKNREWVKQINACLAEDDT